MDDAALRSNTKYIFKAVSHGKHSNVKEKGNISHQIKFQ